MRPARVWRLFVAAAVIVMLAGIAWRALRVRRSAAGRTFRIGCENSPPWQIRQPDGSVVGPALEILSVAARRRGIGLVWIPTPGGPDRNIPDGRVDLWPLAGRFPERLRKFHVSEPWVTITYWLVTREETAVHRPADLAHRRVASARGAVSSRIAASYLPQSRRVESESQWDALESLCKGEVEGAVVAESLGDTFMARRPAVCVPVRFRILSLPGASLGFGVAACRRTPGAVDAADVLREEIGEMARDGALASIALNWSLQFAGQTMALYDATAARRRTMSLAVGSAFLCAILGALAWQTVRLRKATQLASQASRAKSEFLANMSHEIRTPLNGILGMLALAQMTGDASEQRECTQTARASAEALRALLDDILDLSKIEAGKLALTLAPFAPLRLIEDACKTFLVQARRKGLELRLEPTTTLPPAVTGDPLRVRQVLLNLMGNAIKFTDQGRVTVAAEVCAEQPDGLLLRYSVADTGIGIPKPQQSLIFEEFRQADNSASRRFGGSGLGLAISARLVAMMGGRLWVESEEGHGSTFYFTTRCLPAREEDLAEPPREEHAAPPSGAARLRVLLAEDNHVNQKVAAGLLKRLGHDVVVAANGAEALALHAGQEFDLILMDIQMPDLDGLEATSRIRERERGTGRRTPIIAMTACTMTGDREDCLAAGMDAYVAKPINMNQLVSAIRQVIVAGAAQ